jgi:hypothetical protein
VYSGGIGVLVVHVRISAASANQAFLISKFNNKGKVAKMHFLFIF